MFGAINQQAVGGFQELVRSPRYGEIALALKKFKKNMGASRIRLTPHPLLFDRDDFDRLTTAVSYLLSALDKVVAKTLARHSREEVLAIMGLNPEWVHLVDWDQLSSGRHRVARVDVLPTEAGPLVCELNFSAAVGGAELYSHYRVFADAIGFASDDHQFDPLNNLAEMYAATCGRYGFERIHLLDWSSHASLGYPSAMLTGKALRRELPSLRLEEHDELSWSRCWRHGESMAKTLIHRRFTYDDLRVNEYIYLQMLNSGARFSNGLEAELLMSKGWLAAVCDPSNQHEMNVAELEAIHQFLIPTWDLSTRCFAEMRERKNEFVFKKKVGYGGQEVLPGDAVDERMLAHLMSDSEVRAWVFQPMMDSPEVEHLHWDSHLPRLHRTVLGLYLHESRFSGMVVRSASGARIINAGTGASATWAPALSLAEREVFMGCVRDFAV